MLRNYFKIAVRSLLKHKAYSFINVIGLTLGLTSCLVIFQYVALEYSYDDFHKNEENLFRITTFGARGNEEPGSGAYTGYALAPAIIEAVPEIQYAARLHPEYSAAIVSNPAQPDRVFEEDEVFYADPSFLKMFTFPLLSGNKENALTESTMLISESAAVKYFGSKNPIGMTLHLSGEIENTFKITGVFKDVPSNSHLRFNMLLPMNDLLKGETYSSDPDAGWNWNNFITYIRLNPEADRAVINSKLTKVFLSFAGEKLRSLNIKTEIQIQPLHDIYLNDKVDAPNTVMGSYKTVYFFSIIGIVTLLIAMINYVNLATARSLDRSREVGVRKVVGAQRTQLIIQFLCESALTNLIAAVLAVMLTELTIPVINNLANIELVSVLWMQPVLWIAFILTFGLCTFLAGMYPAFLLSSFRPVTVLKGKMGSFKTQLWLRRGLVILQFTASAILIGGTAIVYDQLNYMRQIDLGFELERVLTVRSPRVVPEGTKYKDAISKFNYELRKMPSIVDIATSSTLPGQGFNWNGASVRKSSDDPSSSIRSVITYVDSAFLHLYGMELVAGNGFSDITNLSLDSVPWPVIANETAIKTLGISNPSAAIGQSINIGGYDSYIVGVLKDYNWSSAHTERQNILLAPTTGGEHISLKVNTNDLRGTISSIESLYENLFPGNVFNYAFVEEKFDEQYKKDERFANLFTVFAGLAIMIACLGLFGLAAFTTRQRKKEIGVRKVLGASVPEIVSLLSKDSLKLIFVSVLIAIPVVYFLMSTWLESFAYRTTIGPGIFILTGIIVFAIAILTVSYQSIRAALYNPVNSLRYE